MAIPPKKTDWKIELEKAAKESCEKNKVEQWLDEKLKEKKKDNLEIRSEKNKTALNIESNKRVETFKKIYISERKLSKISEIFLIKTIKENSCSIEIIITIGETTVEIGKVNEKRNQFEKTYLEILPVLSNFDNIYGTKHEVVKEDGYWADYKYLLKTEVRIPITSSKRTEILQVFFNSKWGKLYQQIKSSTLYSAITEKMNEHISNVITSSYNNQNSSANISFAVGKRSISSFKTINFLEIGYGEMSEDACWIIAFLIYEHAYDCCLQQDLLKQMTSSIYKYEDYEYNISGIQVGFYIELKPNTNLISW